MNFIISGDGGEGERLWIRRAEMHYFFKSTFSPVRKLHQRYIRRRSKGGEEP